MIPIDFPEANRRYVAPPGMDNCGDLPTHADLNGAITSCWEVSDTELAMIAQTRRLWLIVTAVAWRMPPVMVSAVAPRMMTCEPPPPTPVEETMRRSEVEELMNSKLPFCGHPSVCAYERNPEGTKIGCRWCDRERELQNVVDGLNKEVRRLRSIK